MDKNPHKKSTGTSPKLATISAFLTVVLALLLTWIYIWPLCIDDNKLPPETIAVIEIIPTETEQGKIARVIISLKPQLDPKIADIIATSVVKNSKKYNLPASLVVSIMNRESGFNTMAVSSMGAKGLMQVMTKVHKDKMKKMGINNYEAMHINNSIKLGCNILREYLNTAKTTEDALERYVGGKHKGYIKDVLATYLNINMMLSEKKVEVKDKDTSVETVMQKNDVAIVNSTN